MWFAFKFCIFDILLHPWLRISLGLPRCDLLSNFVSLIFCYIYDDYREWADLRCDLLSNFVSLIFCYIGLHRHGSRHNVVICFQILYLWYSVTSSSRLCSWLLRLWFAFKFCIFDILLHPADGINRNEYGCDLLSNFVSLIFCYISPLSHVLPPCVVICFQILYLWYSVTSNGWCWISSRSLWFAFKFCIFDILLHL